MAMHQTKGEEMTFKKFDNNKIRLDLLPTEALEEIAKVLEFGAKKYGDYNWLKGCGWTRLYGACLRHLFAWCRGQDTDDESGLNHLAHAGCCILFLLTFKLGDIGQDNRYKPVDNIKMCGKIDEYYTSEGTTKCI